MRRRMIVLFSFLWGIGCFALLCVFAEWYRDTDDALPKIEMSFTAQDLPAINFPYHLSGTDLLLRGMYPYDGAFWEDGSGQEVIGVTALLLENIGNYGIENARVVVCQGERLLKFTADTIPPGAQIVVLEEERTAYTRDLVKYCYGVQRLQLEGWDLSVVNLKNPSMGELLLSNPSDTPIKKLCLLYKDYLQGMYIGGVTYAYTVEEILPGETISIRPGRFAGDSSKVLCILTD